MPVFQVRYAIHGLVEITAPTKEEAEQVVVQLLQEQRLQNDTETASAMVRREGK